MLMPLQTPLIEQTTGFAFDSNDFAMHFAPIHSLQVQPQTTSMEEWDDDDGDKEDEKPLIEVEIDPDLEDDDEDQDTADEGGEESFDDDDDEFEQYLFGEDDE